MTMNPILSIQNIRRDFKMGDETVHVLRGVSFDIYPGEFVTIMGKLVAYRLLKVSCNKANSKRVRTLLICFIMVNFTNLSANN